MVIKIISIHAAREGGDVDGVNANHGDIISIHAAREGGDLTCAERYLSVQIFQSTPPVKAATFNTRHCNFRNAVISIHAAREGGDIGEHQHRN